MKRILISLATALLAAGSLFAQLPPDSLLRRYAAGMLMVGFKGDSVTEDCDAARYVRDLHVGAIVLFDIDVTGDATLGSRNITSKERLTHMTAQLQAWADYPLLIATDQEGGRVARLKPQYGFLPTVTAEYLGTVDCEDTTRYYAARLAREMRESGVNVNLAPVVDVLNHDCAAVGHYNRCYSTAPDVIARHAGWFIDECHHQGVLCTLKHFPGLGAEDGNTHSDKICLISRSLDQLRNDEFKAFKGGIDAGADFVMVGHQTMECAGDNLPSDLSYTVMTKWLRNELGYNGIIITDSQRMVTITSNYKSGEAAKASFAAGADVILIPNDVDDAFMEIYKAVRSGEIPESRLNESVRRILRVKAEHGLLE